MKGRADAKNSTGEVTKGVAGAPVRTSLARKLSVDDLIELRRWLDGNPEVPRVLGLSLFEFHPVWDGVLPKTFLLSGRLPWGEEVQ